MISLDQNLKLLKGQLATEEDSKNTTLMSKISNLKEMIQLIKDLLTDKLKKLKLFPNLIINENHAFQPT